MDEYTQRVLASTMQDANALMNRFEEAQPTLRQRYAMAALTGMLADSTNNPPVATLAKAAFAAADAMLAAAPADAQPVAWLYETASENGVARFIQFELIDAEGFKRTPLYTHSSADAQPVAWQARCSDGGEWRTGWHTLDDGEDEDYYRAKARSEPDKYEVRPLYAAPSDRDREDAERLDFVLDRLAFVEKSATDAGPTAYRLMTQNEDEDFVALSGEDSYFKSPRAAIDAAIASAKGGAK